MKTIQIGYVFLIVWLGGGSSRAEPLGGRVVWWGDNLGGQTQSRYESGTSTGIVSIVGAPLSGIVAVAAGYFHCLALKDNGTVIGWGFNHLGLVTGSATADEYTTNGPVIVEGVRLSNVVAVAAANFSLALKRDGSIVAFGDNKVPPGLSDVVAIAAGGFHSLALRRNGTVVGWQSRPWAETEVPDGLSNVVAIATGDGEYEHSMALRRDGTVVVWGIGIPREKPVPIEVTNVVAIAAGSAHCLALKRDGTVFGWGLNRDGRATGIPTPSAGDVGGSSRGLVRLGGTLLSNVVAVSAASGYSLALKRDSTVVLWGNPGADRSVPAGLTSVVAIAAAKEFCLAVTTNATALPGSK
jgi:alpha-tubulin suppressor-like RCC1 family protein